MDPNIYMETWYMADVVLQQLIIHMEKIKVEEKTTQLLKQNQEKNLWDKDGEEFVKTLPGKEWKIQL